MSALPRPDLPPGPRRELDDALHELHHRAGFPSLRRLAAEAGCSHTTVSHVFSSPRLPTWGILEVLVEAMDGDGRHFRDLWQAAAAPAEPSTRSTATGPPIAGRRAELSAVRRHLEAGSGLLLVTGEAGIGKTTLVAAAGADAGRPVATGHCLPLSSQVPLMPVIDLLRAALATDGGRWVEEALAQHPPHVTQPLGQLMPELGDGTARSSDEFARQRLFTAITALLTALADLRPLTVLVEDLHWADSSTLDLLEHVVARRTGVPIVGTWRVHDDTAPDVNTAWYARVRRSADVAALALDPLSRDETAEQLAAHGSRQDPDQVYARTRGHPLFTAQLADRGDAEEWPRMLGDLLDARLGALDGPEWQLVRALGVADRPLEVAVLGTVAGLDHDATTLALRRLAHRHLLGADDRADHVALGHPLLAEAVRRRLVPGEGGTTHRRLAEALVGRTDADPAEVSQHWQRAGDLERELEWRVRAAHEAHARIAPHEESEHWLRVLDLWPPDAGSQQGMSRPQVQLAAIAALEFSGAEDRALVLAQEAAEGPLEPADRAALLHTAAAFTWGQLGPVPALDLVDEVIRIRRELGDPAQVAGVLVLRANLLAASGRHDECLPVLAEAHRLAESLDDAQLTWKVCSTAVWHHAANGDLAGALAQVEAAHAALREPDPRAATYLAMMHTDAFLMHTRPADELLTAAADALAVRENLHLDFTLSHMVASNVAQALLREGRLSEAEQLLPRQVGDSTRYADWPLRMVAAMAGVVRGQLDIAERALGLPAQADPLNDLCYRLPGVEALVWRGEPGRALDLLLPLLESVPGRHTGFAGPAFRLAARAVADCRAAGLPEATSRREQLLRLRSTATVDPLGPGPVPGDRLPLTSTWDAELARFDGADTVDGWLLAASQWGRLRAVHDAAYCRWRAAQVALHAGDGTATSRLLERAARDAREHVPLSRLIAATVGARP